MNDHRPLTDDDLNGIIEQVWDSYLDPDGTDRLVRTPSDERPTEISASVSLTGAWRGHVVVSCSRTASRNAAAVLLAVDLLDVTQSDIVDAVGELANVIGGNVKALLPQPCQLSLPHVQINGDSGWPVAIEVSRITGTWLDEPVTVSVLASQTQKEV